MNILTRLFGLADQSEFFRTHKFLVTAPEGENSVFAPGIPGSSGPDSEDSYLIVDSNVWYEARKNGAGTWSIDLVKSYAAEGKEVSSSQKIVDGLSEDIAKNRIQELEGDLQNLPYLTRDTGIGFINKIYNQVLPELTAR